MKTVVKTFSLWLPSLLWMALIFVMSAMPGDVSGAQSGALLDLLMGALSAFLGDYASMISPDLLHLLIRKGAHMAEYAVLALLNVRALKKSAARRPLTAAFLMTAAYAATDEFHQAFVGGRGPSPADVMIDAAGAAIALLAYFLLCKKKSRII